MATRHPRANETDGSSCSKQNLRHFPSPLLMFHFLEAAAAEYGGSKTHIDCESVCTCGCWPAVAPDVPRCIGGVLFAIGNVRCRACYWTHTHTCTHSGIWAADDG